MQTLLPTNGADRLLTLRKQVEHRDPKALAAAVYRMLIRYRGELVDDEASDALVAVYVSTLSDVPVWAAIQACDEWHTKKFDPEASTIHPPSAAQLHAAAVDIAGWSIRELDRLEASGGRPIRYRAVGPGEKTVGEIEEERLRAERGEGEWRPPTAEAKDRADRMISELKEKIRNDHVETVYRETPEEAARRRRYDEVAAISKGKAPVAGAVIPAEHRIDVPDLPARDTRTEAQKTASAKAWLESYAAEHGVDLSSIPDQPSTFHRPRVRS